MVSGGLVTRPPDHHSLVGVVALESKKAKTARGLHPYIELTLKLRTTEKDQVVSDGIRPLIHR